jgi:hypothetical protein
VGFEHFVGRQAVDRQQGQLDPALGVGLGALLAEHVEEGGVGEPDRLAHQPALRGEGELQDFFHPLRDGVSLALSRYRGGEDFGECFRQGAEQPWRAVAVAVVVGGCGRRLARRGQAGEVVVELPGFGVLKLPGQHSPPVGVGVGPGGEWPGARQDPRGLAAPLRRPPFVLIDGGERRGRRPLQGLEALVGGQRRILRSARQAGGAEASASPADCRGSRRIRGSRFMG